MIGCQNLPLHHANALLQITNRLFGDMVRSSPVESCSGPLIGFNELATNYFLMIRLHVYRPNPTGAEMWRMKDQYLYDMFIEAGVALLATLTFMFMQWAACQQFSAHIRRYSWIASGALGIVFCWTRWLIYELFRLSPVKLTDSLDFSIAFILAAIAALFCVRWNARSARRH